MAFEIGERVTNKFCGPGTIQGPLVKDEDGAAMQFVAFDSPLLKARLYPVSRLQTLEPEPVKKVIIKKSPADLDFESAVIEGLTYFTTNKNIKKDDPKLDSPTFLWLKVELASRQTRITIYATTANAEEVITDLMVLTGWDYDKASDYVTVRDRKGGPKWNIDFVNFPQLGFDTRDALNVNFGHYSASKDVSDIRRIRIGSTKLVQELIRSGFSSSIQKRGGDGE